MGKTDEVGGEDGGKTPSGSEGREAGKPERRAVAGGEEGQGEGEGEGQEGGANGNRLTGVDGADQGRKEAEAGGASHSTHLHQAQSVQKEKKLEEKNIHMLIRKHSKQENKETAEVRARKTSAKKEEKQWERTKMRKQRKKQRRRKTKDRLWHVLVALSLVAAVSCPLCWQRRRRM